MKLFIRLTVLSTVLGSAIAAFADCDAFVAWTKPAIDKYQQKHRVYPIPDPLRKLAVRYMPRLWVHPDSWHPIDFDDYLAGATLIDSNNGNTLQPSPTATALSRLISR